MNRRVYMLVFVAVASLGYMGAAVVYSYLIGLNWQAPLACPVCPHILSLGDLLDKFVRRVLKYGTLNAALFLVVWRSLLGAYRARRIHH